MHSVTLGVCTSGILAAIDRTREYSISHGD